MDRYTRIHAINKVLKEYFEDNPNQGPIPAKEFMELFVEKGIFNQDSRGGLPIRKLLRELDSENRLSAYSLCYRRNEEGKQKLVLCQTTDKHPSSFRTN